ncbi:MAG: hypothetical protein ACTTIC_03665 [Helicobacteraceae bacterium]
MLKAHLQDLGTLIGRLLEITRLDVEDVMNAKHESFFSRSKEKEKLTADFQKLKKTFDDALLELSRSDTTKTVLELLSQDELVLRDEIQANLEKLHEENKKLAALVVTTADLYNSLLAEILKEYEPGQGGGKEKGSLFSIKG